MSISRVWDWFHNIGGQFVDKKLLGTLIITSLFTVWWGYRQHTLAVEREKEHRLEEQRIQYLISAYRRLATGVYRGSLFNAMDEVQSAIADIYLFGTEAQVSQAQTFVQEVTRDKTANVDGLLLEIRRQLRAELGLQPADMADFWWLVRGEQTEDGTPEQADPGD